MDVHPPDVTLDLPIVAGPLTLRAMTATDVDDAHAFLSLPEVNRYLYRDPLARHEASAWVAASRRARLGAVGDVLRLGVTVDGDDTVVGSASLAWRSAVARQAEVGYLLHPRVARCGYGGIAARAMLELGFATFRFHRIYARIDAENTASIRICERLGMRREAHLIDNDRWNGRWGSEVIYAMRRREWEASPPVT